MRILIAAASFAANLSGLQRHALNVVRCLLTLPETSELHFVIAPWQRDSMQVGGLYPDARLTTHIADMEQSSLSRNLWHYRTLPQLAARLQADLVHFSYPAPVNPSFPCPTVVTLHDLYPYEIPMNFGFPKFIFNRTILRQCLRNADAIACVSDATSARLRQYMPPSIWRKALRIYNCVEAEPLSAARSPIPGWWGQPFLLCVAQHRRNKNIPLLIRAFHRLLRSGRIDRYTELAVVGISGPETDRIYRLTAACGLSRRIHFLEGLSEPELQWCYRHCEALAAPSTTEGFGLPVVEALLAGCRVVCSDIPAHREVGEGQCRFIALGRDAEEGLASAIAAALRKPKKQPITLPQFSAPVLARQYIGLYRGLTTKAARARGASASGSVHIDSSERQPL